MKKDELKTLRYEIIDDIALITVNRPSVLNAVNSEMLSEFSVLLDSLEKDSAVSVIILTGSGKAFVAGADIAQMQALSTLDGRAFCLQGQRLFNKIEELEKPVIAAVNGYAFGAGCELAMACDIRIASQNAKFGLPELGLGLIPGFGGTQRLTRIIGIGRAKYHILTGETIGSEEAFRLALVEKVVPEEALLSTAMEIARRIKAKAPVAVRMAKTAINKGAQMDLASGIAFEAEAYSLTFSTEDRLEGLSAFLEKRPPRFSGR